MDKKVAELLNAQINAELYSAYLYLDFANFYDEHSMDGFKSWFKKQAEEEMEHAMKFLEYMQLKGEKVTLEAIAKPDKPCKELVDPLKYSVEHEKYVTSLIYAIYDAALEAKDFGTTHFLDWFVEEQNEEEDNAETNLAHFERYGHEAKALYALDGTMGERSSSSNETTEE